MKLYLDIETIGTVDQDIVAEITDGIGPPGNISKAETIAAWEANTKPALVDQAIRKTAFDGTYGRIICVGFAFDDASADSITHEDERTMLLAFDKLVRPARVLESAV